MAACWSTSVSGNCLPISGTRLNFKASKCSTTHSQAISFKSNLSLSTQSLIPKLQIKGLRNRNIRTVRVPIIYAAQSNFFRAIQTVLKVGKDGIEAGTNLVPDAVPRPIASLLVTVVAVALSLFVLRSFLNTVVFALGVMGFVYFIYLALNKDKGSKMEGSPGSTDEAIEEAKRIMDKYK